MGKRGYAHILEASYRWPSLTSLCCSPFLSYSTCWQGTILKSTRTLRKAFSTLMNVSGSVSMRTLWLLSKLILGSMVPEMTQGTLSGSPLTGYRKIKRSKLKSYPHTNAKRLTMPSSTPRLVRAIEKCKIRRLKEVSFVSTGKQQIWSFIALGQAERTMDLSQLPLFHVIVVKLCLTVVWLISEMIATLMRMQRGNTSVTTISWCTWTKLEAFKEVTTKRALKNILGFS